MVAGGKNGSRIRIRPIKRDDAEQCLEFMVRLGPDSRYLRFHHLTREKVLAPIYWSGWPI